MQVATSGVRIEVGVRELKNNLSRYLERIALGDELIVTDRGRPIARMTSVDASIDKLAALVASGAVQPPASATRRRPSRRITPADSVSELVDDQRR